MVKLAGVDEQRLWVVRWGTQTAMVWARTAENAERKARTQKFSRNVSQRELDEAIERVRGEVTVRAAVPSDREWWEACEGPKVRWPWD